MTCKLVFNSVPVGPPYYLAGPYRTSVQCVTHGMVDFAPVCSPGDTCPVGKIEKATEEGLKKIEEALKGVK